MKFAPLMILWHLLHTLVCLCTRFILLKTSEIYIALYLLFWTAPKKPVALRFLGSGEEHILLWEKFDFVTFASLSTKCSTFARDAHEQNHLGAIHPDLAFPLSSINSVDLHGNMLKRIFKSGGTAKTFSTYCI